jgi:hypothetical protein
MANFLKSFTLKSSLLRIWFMKNISLFLKLGMYVMIVLVLTGQVDANTPILGGIFGDLSRSIRDVLTSDYDSNTLINLVTVVVTFLVTLGTLSHKLKSIGLNDIKSNSLKKALVQAGMYFNKEGKLVNRLEETSKIDFNGDGFIGETGVSINDIPEEKFIDGMKRAGDELKTIVTLKVGDNYTLDKVIDKTNILEGTLAKKEEVITEQANLKDLGIDIIRQQSEEYEDEPSLIFKVLNKVALPFVFLYKGFVKLFNLALEKLMGYEYEEVPYQSEALFEEEEITEEDSAEVAEETQPAPTAPVEEGDTNETEQTTVDTDRKDDEESTEEESTSVEEEKEEIGTTISATRNMSAAERIRNRYRKV